MKKTSANRESPASRKIPASRKTKSETEKMTPQPKKNVTKSFPSPTLERQPPTSTSKMTLPVTTMKTMFTMEPKNYSKSPLNTKKIKTPRKITPPKTQSCPP